MAHVLLGGVGMGLVFVPMLIAVQGAVPRHELGVATSVTQFFRAIGGTLGLSVMGTVMAQRLQAGLPVASAVHGVFVVGAVICALALLSTLLVPRGAPGTSPGPMSAASRPASRAEHPWRATHRCSTASPIWSPFPPCPQ